MEWLLILTGLVLLACFPVMILGGILLSLLITLPEEMLLEEQRKRLSRK